MNRLFHSISLWAACALLAAVIPTICRAQTDFPNTATTAPDTGKPYTVEPSSFLSDAYYGMDHGGSYITISNLTFSNGQASFTLNVYEDNFTARNSEGVFSAEFWVEQNTGLWPGTYWHVLSNDTAYPVNVNSGTPPAGAQSWSNNYRGVAPGTQFRVFGYSYVYNQGGGQQGEYALYSWMGPVTVPSPVQMTPPTSSNSSVTYGQTWAPSVSGGEGIGPYVYCIVGQTSYANVSNQWTANVTPGTYQFYVGQLPDGTNVGNLNGTNLGNIEYNPSPYTLTITPAPVVTPTSQNTTATVGQAWTPPIVSAGSGGTIDVFSVVWNGTDGTNLATYASPWIPIPADAGQTFTFYVGLEADANHTGALTDPHLPGATFSLNGPYTVMVNATIPPTVSIAPAASTIYAGQSITFTASGGLNGYVWGSSGSGSGTRQTVTFPNVGNYTVTVYSPAGGNYTMSNTATATITVVQATQATVSISPTSQTITAGNSITFTASGGSGTGAYTWGGTAGATGTGTTNTVSFPTVGTYTVTVYRAADTNYTASNTATAAITVNPDVPPTVSISPPISTIYPSQSITFTASGGLNGYVWGSSASGSGTSQTVTFPNVGNYTVTVYSPAGGNYSVSNTATAMITVNLATPPTVYVAPASSTIYAGQSITFTASGGTNGYVWGGSASGSGTSQTVTFPSTGSYSVTVYSPAGGIYAVSNTATATITVNPPLVTASISANPTSGVAPASSTITWTSSNATSVSVSGTGLSSSSASGSQLVGPFSAGMYTYTITATGPGGSAAPTATFVVSAGFLTVSPSGTVQFPDAVRDTLALGPNNISGGAISSTKVFTLQNTGNAPLNITGTGLSGTSSSCFTVQTQLTLPYALAPGASVQVTLVFTPGALGSAAPIGAVPNTTFSVTSDVNTPPPVTIFGICRAPKISITWHQ